MRQRDIIFIKFPYSDLSSAKFRPALVVSNDKYNSSNDDILMCAITSNLETSEFSLIFSGNDVEEGKFPIRSKIRADKIMLISKSLASRKIATLSRKKFSETTALIAKLVKG